MPRIPFPDEYHPGDSETEGVFSEIRTKTGGAIPAPYRAFSRQSHILQANWNRTKRILSEGSLPLILKESIALAVSNANKCHFCIHIHQKNLQKQNIPEEEILRRQEGKSSEKKIESVLQFCIRATRNPHSLTEKNFSQLRDLGYSDNDILEMLTVMEMFTGYNKIIVALDILIDD